MIWRVQDKRTFEALRRSGRRVRAGSITVTWAPGAAVGPPQVAFAIGRKVGGAVVRNRLRRRMRSILRECGPGMAPGAYLVGASPDAATVSFEELRAMVSEGLRAVVRGGRR